MPVNRISQSQIFYWQISRASKNSSREKEKKMIAAFIKELPDVFYNADLYHRHSLISLILHISVTLSSPAHWNVSHTNADVCRTRRRSGSVLKDKRQIAIKGEVLVILKNSLLIRLLYMNTLKTSMMFVENYLKLLLFYHFSPSFVCRYMTLICLV